MTITVAYWIILISCFQPLTSFRYISDHHNSPQFFCVVSTGVAWCDDFVLCCRVLTSQLILLRVNIILTIGQSSEPRKFVTASISKVSALFSLMVSLALFNYRILLVCVLNSIYLVESGCTRCMIESIAELPLRTTFRLSDFCSIFQKVIF